jgi:hypothetical protein
MPQQAHRQRHGALEIPLDELTEGLTLSVTNAREKLALAIGAIGRAEHERCA